MSEKLLQLPSAHPGIKAASQRLDAANRRFSNDLKTLALIRKLLRPIPSTLDLLKQPIADKNVGGAAAQRDAASLSSGVPVLTVLPAGDFELVFNKRIIEDLRSVGNRQTDSAARPASIITRAVKPRLNYASPLLPIEFAQSAADDRK